MPNEIKLILTDLDGTLVDTRAANYHAYREVLSGFGKVLSEEHYNQCFGLRLEEFLLTIDIDEPALINEIKKQKALTYPRHFDKLVTNCPLLSFLQAVRRMRTPLGVVSTARRENIVNVLQHIQALNVFDLIVSGEDVQTSKPDPECYVYAIEHFGVDPDSTLVFEDTQIGIRAALAAGADCMVIGSSFYGI